MDKLNWLQHVLQASIDKLLLIFGSVFILLSFVSISRNAGNWDFSLVRTPNWVLLLIGLVQFGSSGSPVAQNPRKSQK